MVDTVNNKKLNPIVGTLATAAGATGGYFAAKANYAAPLKYLKEVVNMGEDAFVARHIEPFYTIATNTIKNNGVILENFKWGTSSLVNELKDQGFKHLEEEIIRFKQYQTELVENTKNEFTSCANRLKKIELKAFKSKIIFPAVGAIVGLGLALLATKIFKGEKKAKQA